jgi:cytochrome c oxidase assembly protein subunit 15
VPGGLRHGASALLGLASLTLLSGGFVAGLRAGLVYNTFPLMDGRLVPEGYAPLQPLWLNWFETIPAVQFNHRLLAVLTFTAVLALWGLWRARTAGPVRSALDLLLAAACLQVALGISTLLLVVPTSLAAAHQAGAMLLISAVLNLRHACRAPAGLPRVAPAAQQA